MTSNERLQILFMLRIKCTTQEGAKCPSTKEVECPGTEGERGPTRCRIRYVGCSSPREAARFGTIGKFRDQEGANCALQSPTEWGCRKIKEICDLPSVLQRLRDGIL